MSSGQQQQTIHVHFVGGVAAVLATGFQVLPDPSNDGVPVAPGAGNSVVLEMPAAPAAPAAGAHQLPRALWTVSLLTLIFVIGTAVYKPATGVIFGHNKVAYYVVLGLVFVSGIAEASAAFWISRSSLAADRRRFSVGRVVLCFSVGPFVTITGIGCFRFIEA